MLYVASIDNWLHKRESVLKTIAIALVLTVLMTAATYATVHFETNGSYITTVDATNQFGAAGGLGLSIHKNINFIYRGSYTMNEVVSNDQFGMKPSMNYSHMFHVIGIEYILPIEAIRIGWRTSANIGYSITHSEDIDLLKTIFFTRLVGLPLFKKNSLNDIGPAIAFWTGIEFNAKQFLAPFVDIGFHKSLYSGKMLYKNISGMSILFGVRFYLTGIKNLDDDY
jgi:hypothetical protein